MPEMSLNWRNHNSYYSEAKNDKQSFFFLFSQQLLKWRYEVWEWWRRYILIYIYFMILMREGDTPNGAFPKGLGWLLHSEKRKKRGYYLASVLSHLAIIIYNIMKKKKIWYIQTNYFDISVYHNIFFITVKLKQEFLH